MPRPNSNPRSITKRVYKPVFLKKRSIGCWRSARKLEERFLRIPLANDQQRFANLLSFLLKHAEVLLLDRIALSLRIPFAGQTAGKPWVADALFDF